MPHIEAYNRRVTSQTRSAVRVKRVLTTILRPAFRVANRVVLDRHYARAARQHIPRPLPEFGGPLLLVFPHVDDETIALGGQLVRWARRRVRADLVYTTDSSAGGDGAAPSDRARTRSAEAHDLARRTRIGSVTTLSGVNGDLLGSADRLVAELEELLGRTQYEAVFVVGPVDAHPEHRLSAAMAATALSTAGFSGPVIVGENSNLLPLGLVTHAGALTRAELHAKDQLFTVFRSQRTMGFEVFHDLARSKRRLVPGSYAAELFHLTDNEGLARLVADVERSGPAQSLPHRIGNSWSLWRVLTVPDMCLDAATSVVAARTRG